MWDFTKAPALIEALKDPKGFVTQDLSVHMVECHHTNGVCLQAQRLNPHENVWYISIIFPKVQTSLSFESFEPTFLMTKDTSLMGMINATSQDLVQDLYEQMGALAWARVRALSHVVSTHFQISQGVWEEVGSHDAISVQKRPIALPPGYNNIRTLLQQHNLLLMQAGGKFQRPKTLPLEPYPSHHLTISNAPHIAWVRERLVLPVSMF